MYKAWSTLEIKSIDAEQRIIEGIASTPSADRDGDVMDPLGAEYVLPLPFLWFHQAREPIGEVFEARPTADGIYIKARVAKVTKAGSVRDRVEEAWASFTSTPPLVRGLSIGWNPIERHPLPNSKLTKHTRWMWGELSAVTIPANVNASILAVKQFDQPAALGPSETSSGVSDTLPVVRVQKDAAIMTTEMTTAEQIHSFEVKREANVGLIKALMEKASGATLDDKQREEYTTLEREVDSIDEHLPRLRKLQEMQIKSATPVTAATNTTAASEIRGGQVAQVRITPMQPKGTAFTRYAMALAGAKGDSYRALERAKSWSDMPEVEQMVRASLSWDGKAAVAAGTTTDSTWAGPLAVAQPLVDEFLDLLRPRTLIGRIPGFTQVPFNVSVAAQTGGGTYSWVGQGNAKPVTKNDFATVSLGINKAAGIIVLTEELVKVSSPSAEAKVRNDMVQGMATFLDTQLVDPAVAVSAGVNPASITNGATTAASAGATGANAKADLVAMVQAFTAAEFALGESVFLMNEANAFALSVSVNGVGNPLFPGFNGQDGGMLFGVRTVVSNSVGARVILVHTPSILFADDGGVNIDASREASIQMDSAPSNPADATTVYVSLWQRNLVGLRAERFITWLRARTGSVIVRTAASYTGA